MNQNRRGRRSARQHRCLLQQPQLETLSWPVTNLSSTNRPQSRLSHLFDKGEATRIQETRRPSFSAQTTGGTKPASASQQAMSPFPKYSPTQPSDTLQTTYT